MAITPSDLDRYSIHPSALDDLQLERLSDPALKELSLYLADRVREASATPPAGEQPDHLDWLEDHYEWLFDCTLNEFCRRERMREHTS